jgi:hypothetical protein
MTRRYAGKAHMTSNRYGTWMFENTTEIRSGERMVLDGSVVYHDDGSRSSTADVWIEDMEDMEE